MTTRTIDAAKRKHDAAKARHQNVRASAHDLADKQIALGLNPLQGTSKADREAFTELEAAYAKCDEIGTEVEQATNELHAALDAAAGSSIDPGDSYAYRIADEAARLIVPGATEAHGAALVTSPIDVPHPVGIIAGLPHDPNRLVDLIVDRRQLTEGNKFQYLRQTARTNNAAPVADGATKPTSVFTVAPQEGEASVVAHLSEPMPERFLQDHEDFVMWFGGEMVEGVTDAIEDQLLNGDGTGANQLGILNTSGILNVTWSTDLLTTIRKGGTALAAINEQPTALAINPQDAERVDLATDNQGQFHSDLEARIFQNVRRIQTNSVPAGQAILGDWRQVRLFVRESMRVDGDRSGTNFSTNSITWRAEARVGHGVLRPQAFAVLDLTA